MGEGGNAVVHIICDVNKNNYAIKELDLARTNTEKKARFQSEIKIMSENQDLESIMPVLDSNVEEYWYVMPIAEPIINSFNISKFDDFTYIQELLISLVTALYNIHSRNLSHRDIKPDNIYILNSNVCFGDFGLVDFPDNLNDFTKSDKGLGAIFTIAPEMKRNPKGADGKKADIYSLAKTIWILLTGEIKGFEGQYLVNGDYSLRNYEHLRGKHLVELENILQMATSFEPDARPTAERFVLELKRWKSVSNDFEQYQISEWDFLNKCLFGEVLPDTAIWSEKEAIIKVLNLISSLPVFSHMLFSNKGGLDFKKASEANEKGCIQIIDDFGWIYILKSKKLYFERFVDPAWNYFLLTMDKLEPIIVENNGYSDEQLVEDFPGHYTSARYAQYGVYDYDSGEKLPEGYRVVSRCLDGALLFVVKNGYYNRIHATYDGRHGMCHPLHFRQYIEKLCDFTEKLKNKGFSFEKIEIILNNKEYSRNPFASTDDEEDETNIEKNDTVEYRDRYISKHIFDWEFIDIINDNKSAKIGECKALYYIEYHNTEFILSDFIHGNGMVVCGLCIDGKFKKSDKSQILYYDSFEDANKVLSQCILKIKKQCDKFGIEENEYCHYPQVGLIKGEIKPSHLFTESEIRDLMREADDRNDNTLVVDVDGTARIIPNRCTESIFPVRTETWDAGNVYVGKYSSLLDARPAYIRVLNGWLRYLKTGKSQYIDFAENYNEEELLSDIRDYY